MLHGDQRHAKSTAEDEVTPTIMKVVITRKLLMLKGLDPIMRKHAFIERRRESRREMEGPWENRQRERIK